MRAFIATLCLYLVCTLASGAALPVSRMQNAVSGVTQSKMVQRGFASNDPRWINTLSSAGSAIAGAAATAATVTALGVTAPAWATVAAGAAVGTAVALALDAGIKWLFKDSGNVQIGDNPTSPNTPAGLSPPSTVWVKNGVVGGTKDAACTGQPPSSGMTGSHPWTAYHAMLNGVCEGFRVFTDTGSVVDAGPDDTFSVFTNNTSRCPGIGLTASAGKCPASNFPEPAGAPVKTISDAAAQLTDPQKAQPLNPQVIADLANEFWKQAAAAPGYNGLPYDATQPVTAADAATWQASNPNYWPSVGDFVAPQVAPSGGTASTPFSMPTSTTPATSADPATQPSIGTNPSTEPLQNLGSDPGIGAPALEPIPTAQQILSPLLNLFPTLKNFAVPSHSSVCPKWTMHILNSDYTLQDHCSMLEQIRPTLYAVMAVTWVLIALFIILAA